jgi:tripartite-type tricarboxylate transporter receptor subunit TctC
VTNRKFTKGNTMKIHSRAAALALSALLALPFALHSAFAADYPTKPVRMIVTFPPGGGMDTMARLIAGPLGDRLKQPVVVDNRPGASGLIGAEAAAKSAPDGYTLLMGSADTHAINPAVFTNIRYDAIKDFAPVALLGDLPMTLVVNPSVPATTIEEFLRVVKERPGKMTYSSWGIGSGSQIAMETILQPGGLQMLHVPFPGSAPAIAAVIGGQVDAMMVTLPTSEGNHASGRVRILGVTPIRRPAGSPDYPRAGMPPDVAIWVGVFAPAKTDPAIVAQLNRDIKSLMDDPAVRASFAKTGLEVVPTIAPPAEFARFVESSYASWGKTVRAANIKVELK